MTRARRLSALHGHYWLRACDDCTQLFQQARRGHGHPCHLCSTCARWRDNARSARTAARLRLTHHTRARQYGMTSTQLLAMVDRQHSRCAICGVLFGLVFEVDHCHACDALGIMHVRELLCSCRSARVNHCNRVVGFCRDDPDHVLASPAVAAYLRRHNADCARLRDRIHS